MAFNPEILVHVEAPSAVSDDARYRALVASCLAFEPASCHSIFRLQDNSDGTGVEVISVDKSRSFVSLSSSSIGQPSISAQHHHEAGGSVNSGDELISLVTSDEFEKSEPPRHNEAPVQPPLNTVQSIGLLPLPPVSTEEESELSFQPLIPLTSQTGTENKSHSFERLESSTRVSNGDLNADPSSTWETPLEVIPDSQNEEADQTTMDDSVQVDRSFVPDSARQSRRFAAIDRTEDPETDITRIPSSMPSPSPRESSGTHRNNLVSDGGPSGSPLREKSSNLQTTQVNPSISASVLGKRKAVTNTDSFQDSITANQNVQASLKWRPKKRPTLPQATEMISLDNLPIEIRAPDPPVSNERFHTHITPTLRSLAERMKQSSRFTPKSQTRDLRPLERGYWFIPHITIIPDTTLPHLEDTNNNDASTPPTWTQTFFSQFWCFLRDFFTEGRSGWGIWCLLEQESIASPSYNSTSTSTSTNTTNGAKIVNMKLYTWGEVAPHLYLLLYLATERRIKKMTRVEWRDARDECVIIM